MTVAAGQIGVLDKRFLAKSLGLLNPPPALILKESSPLREALELLQKHKIGCVVVVDHAGVVKGIFSERDAVLKVALRGMDLDKTPVSEVMTREPQTTKMTATIGYALTMMSQGGYRHIPIVDEENFPVGMISVKNLIDFIVNTVSRELTGTS